MTTEDCLLLLDVLFDVRIGLTLDGEHLSVTGNAEALELLTPRLLQLKPAIVAHLRALADSARPG
jgi:hypothetical protein